MSDDDKYYRPKGSRIGQPEPPKIGMSDDDKHYRPKGVKFPMEQPAPPKIEWRWPTPWDVLNTPFTAWEVLWAILAAIAIMNIPDGKAGFSFSDLIFSIMFTVGIVGVIVSLYQKHKKPPFIPRDRTKE